MRIIPVLDLMGRQVVRGIAGRRAEYRPVVSRLAAGSDPLEIAAEFLRLGLRQIYIADLDAIAGGEPDMGLYRQLRGLDAELIVDAGVASVAAAERLATLEGQGPPLAIVAGLETIPSPQVLAAIVQALGAERIVFSLDLRNGTLLTQSPAWQVLSPLACGETALELGIRRLIVLDLASVGVSQGVSTLGLCRQLRDRHPAIEIISGGGVRGRDDLDALAEAGCDAALVASALHGGTLP